MIDPTTLAAILQSVGQAGPLSSMAATSLPVSAIQQAPSQLAAMQSGGINNIGGALASLNVTPTGGTGGTPTGGTGGTPTGGTGGTPSGGTPNGGNQNTGNQNTGNTSGQSQSKTYQEKLADQYKKVLEQTPSHHSLVSSGAQFVPMDFSSRNPYAPVPSSLFDMLQNMYGV